METMLHKWNVWSVWWNKIRVKIKITFLILFSQMERRVDVVKYWNKTQSELLAGMKSEINNIILTDILTDKINLLNVYMSQSSWFESVPYEWVEKSDVNDKRKTAILIIWIRKFHTRQSKHTTRKHNL